MSIFHPLRTRYLLASLCVAIGALSMVSVSAQSDSQPTTRPQTPDISDILGSPQNDPITEGAEEPPIIDELEALSQTTTDPFGAVEVTKRRKPVSVTLRALDKIIARTIDIEVEMNTLANFGTLEIVPRFCDKRPPEDFPETTAFLEIFDKSPGLAADARKSETDIAAPTEDDAVEPFSADEAVRAAASEGATGDPALLADPDIGPVTTGEKVFSGWMFASTPGLHALEHGVYDVWVIDCKTRLVDETDEEPLP